MPGKRLGARVVLRCSGDAMTANVRKQGARLSGRAFALGGTGVKDDQTKPALKQRSGSA